MLHPDTVELAIRCYAAEIAYRRARAAFKEAQNKWHDDETGHLMDMSWEQCTAARLELTKQEDRLLGSLIS